MYEGARKLPLQSVDQSLVTAAGRDITGLPLMPYDTIQNC